MALRLAAVCVAALLTVAPAAQVSPVQKVIELLEESKGKVIKDLKAEEGQMEEYSSFCDDSLKEKGYAIKTATRAILDLNADIEDSKAVIGKLEDEVAALGSSMAAKDKEVANITAVRTAENTAFEATEKELLGTVDSLSGAIAQIKKGGSFLQDGKAVSQDRLKKMTLALSRIVDAAWVQTTDKKRITKFIQQQQASSEDDDLSLHARQQAETTDGGITETLEDMKDKAEESLTEARKTETKNANAFDLMEQGLQNEIKNEKEKKADATSTLGAKSEELGSASAELAETEKTKAADEAYVASLTIECEETAAAWSARQAEAKEEMGAIDKAKEILTSGVKAFVQVGAASSRRRSVDDGDDFGADTSVDTRRTNLVGKLKKLARGYHSFALMELVTAASQDPFSKIRGLIEDMIAKLVAEANEEATQKAFCDEEIGKSKKSQEEKTMTFDKLKARSDKAETTKANLLQSIKELEEEIQAIDSSQAEATKIRNEEKEEYLQSSKDFKESAEATEQAIVVLKQYYEGALVQTGTSTKRATAPTFGSAKSDTGSSIISILEMCAEDFTKTYTEIEASEAEAVKAYEKLSQENKVARAAKEAEAKAHESEVKSLTVTLGNAQTDLESVSKELDAVAAYLDKLKPQCESKAMSYEEKKAKREAEIEGLKEALSLLA